MEYLWEIVERDGTITPIPPTAVELVQRRWDAGQAIHTEQRSIPAHQIKSFSRSNRPYSRVPLLEAAAGAFNMPLESEVGIICRWVKKSVTQQQYNKFNSHIPAYHWLSEGGGLVSIGFMCPAHLVEKQSVEYCTEDEIVILTRF